MHGPCHCGCGLPAPIAKKTQRKFNVIKGKPQTFIPNHHRRKFQKGPDPFWGKVHKTETCWIWKASTNGKGYGNYRYNGGTIYSHRMSWIIANGPIPNNLYVCHHCDNPW